MEKRKKRSVFNENTKLSLEKKSDMYLMKI